MKKVMAIILSAALMFTSLQLEIAGAEEPLNAPIFNIAEGYYSEPQTVTLSTYSSDTVIRYTIDGSVPTASSPVYVEPIHVDSFMQIRAYAEEVDGSVSE